VTPQEISQPEPPTYIFSARELERLAVYRAAVVARFYNEQCEPVTAHREGVRTTSIRKLAA
jgi:hypothetical protein